MTSSTSFITQCPRCATKFKVTQEQLNISEGWVRCGRCQDIFDAKDHLIDALQSPAPTEAQAQPQPVSPAESAALAAPLTSALDTAPASAADAAGPDADADADADDARPSERWLKELSDTFSPTSPSASLAIAAASAITAPSNSASAPPTEHEHAEAPLNEAHGDQPNDLATHAPAQTSNSPPSPDLHAQPDSDSDSDPAEDGSDNNIASFHAELAQWQGKQTPFAAPSPDADLPAQAAASSFTDGDASPALIHASGTPAPDHDPTSAPVTTSTAQTGPIEDSAQARLELQSNPPEQAANTEAAAEPSGAPETDEARAAREEEERLERYRAEFSETQELRFMREADQKAFWRRPVVRSFMAVLALLLLTLLAAQWVYVQRDSIAALSPQWKDRMQQACAWAGCRITPLQSIEDLVLDGSTFQHAGANRYTLSWTVRNRSNRWIETPALSLSLRNEAGQTLIRRTITADEIAQSPPQLAPGGAWKVEQHLELSDSAKAVTGYQLQIFYPHAAQ